MWLQWGVWLTCVHPALFPGAKLRHFFAPHTLAGDAAVAARAVVDGVAPDGRLGGGDAHLLLVHAERQYPAQGRSSTNTSPLYTRAQPQPMTATHCRRCELAESDRKWWDLAGHGAGAGGEGRPAAQAGSLTNPEKW